MSENANFIFIKKNKKIEHLHEIGAFSFDIVFSLLVFLTWRTFFLRSLAFAALFFLTPSLKSSVPLTSDDPS
jgi:hypothetical protein